MYSDFPQCVYFSVDQLINFTPKGRPNASVDNLHASIWDVESNWLKLMHASRLFQKICCYSIVDRCTAARILLARNVGTVITN